MKFYYVGYGSDKQVLEGDSYDEIVDRLKQGSSGWLAHQANPEYIKGFAVRYEGLTGVPLDHSSPERFIQSLINAGLLEKIA